MKEYTVADFASAIKRHGFDYLSLWFHIDTWYGQLKVTNTGEVWTIKDSTLDAVISRVLQRFP